MPCVSESDVQKALATGQIEAGTRKKDVADRLGASTGIIIK